MTDRETFYDTLTIIIMMACIIAVALGLVIYVWVIK